MAIETGSIEVPGDPFQAWLGRIQHEFEVRAEVHERPLIPFYGTVRRHEVGRLTLLDVTGSSYAATHTRLSKPSLVSVLISLHGATALEQSSFHLNLKAGEFCVLDTGQSSRTVIPAPFRNAMLRLPMAEVQAIVPNWQMAIGTVVDGRSGAAAVFIDTVRSVLQRSESLEDEGRSGISDAAIDLFATALVVQQQFSRPKPSHMENFHRERIKAFVAEHLRDPDLDVDAVARGLGLSVRHIHRLFQGQAQHLMHFVWSERLRHCYADLNREAFRHRTVAEIAYSWGFNDSAHFSRAFRSRYGVSPSDLRKRTPPSDAP